MRVGAVLVARLSSSRLPAKVLRQVAGRPLIGWVHARLEAVSGLDATVVATSDDASDAPIDHWCAEHGVACFRGSLHDVAGRVLSCADEYGLDAVARVNADSPWVDRTLLGHAVAMIRTDQFDVVTNVFERTWPYGISAEVFRVASLRRARDLSDDPDEREHVTRGLYAHPTTFSILNLRSDLTPADGAGAGARFTVDTDEDLQRFERLVAALGERAATVETSELLATARRLERSNRDIR